MDFLFTSAGDFPFREEVVEQSTMVDVQTTVTFLARSDLVIGVCTNSNLALLGGPCPACMQSCCKGQGDMIPSEDGMARSDQPKSAHAHTLDASFPSDHLLQVPHQNETTHPSNHYP